jgi:hypothetical protein
VNSRNFNSSIKAENELIVGGLVVAGGAMTLQYGIQAYKSYQAKQAEKQKNAPTSEPDSEVKNTQKASSSSSSSTTQAKAKAQTQTDSNPVNSPFATWFARNFYDGGFEDKMSKREAALILGVRESASVDRIKEAHRRILLLNHPDRGGSAFIAAKINEAKDLLLKGK